MGGAGEGDQPKAGVEGVTGGGEWRQEKKQGQGGLLQITAFLHKPSRKWHSLSLL